MINKKEHFGILNGSWKRDNSRPVMAPCVTLQCIWRYTAPGYDCIEGFKFIFELNIWFQPENNTKIH